MQWWEQRLLLRFFRTDQFCVIFRRLALALQIVVFTLLENLTLWAWYKAKHIQAFLQGLNTSWISMVICFREGLYWAYQITLIITAMLHPLQLLVAPFPHREVFKRLLDMAFRNKREHQIYLWFPTWFHYLHFTNTTSKKQSLKSSQWVKSATQKQTAASQQRCQIGSCLLLGFLFSPSHWFLVHGVKRIVCAWLRGNCLGLRGRESTSPRNRKWNFARLM